MVKHFFSCRFFFFFFFFLKYTVNLLANLIEVSKKYREPGNKHRPLHQKPILNAFEWGMTSRSEGRKKKKRERRQKNGCIIRSKHEETVELHFDSSHLAPFWTCHLHANDSLSCLPERERRRRRRKKRTTWIHWCHCLVLDTINLVSGWGSRMRGPRRLNRSLTTVVPKTK